MNRPNHITIALSLLAGLTQNALAAPGAATPEETRIRAERRSVWEQYLDASPIERTDLHVDAHLLELEKAYGLNATQCGAIRDKLKSIAERRQKEMGALAVEHESLADRAAEIFWTYREAAEQAEDGPNPLGSFHDNEEYRQARQRMVEIEKRFPIDWDAILTDVETQLPPDQAKQGRQRLHIARIEHAARIAAREARDQKRRLATLAGADPARGEKSAPAVKSVLDQATAKSNEADLDPATRARIRTTIDQARKNMRVDSGEKPATPTTTDPIARDFDRWEAYTRDFIKTRGLSANQQAAALAIMTDLRDRASSLRKNFDERHPEASRVTDKERLAKQSAEIDRRIEGLFGQLARRLDALLTIEQRRAAQQPRSDTPDKTRK
ncbi:MAG TPA: hypothetical protein P5081_04310 [Phycisphaerae bacterium]|nr:hypothetical protein [Phycisphaerae bacterium]HRW52084.1 hypothetical protein [Phycisphaerae bacterium]